MRLYRALKQLSLGSAMASLLLACGGGGSGGGQAGSLNPDSVVAAVSAKIGDAPMTVTQGAPPAPSSSPAAPKTTAGVSGAKTTPGSTANVPLTVQSSAVIASIFAKVRGSASYYRVDISAPTSRRAQAKRAMAKASKQLPGSEYFNLSLQIPSSLGNGQFCVDLSVEDANDLVSNLSGFCIDVGAAVPPPADDQPSANALPSTLAGGWRSACQAFEGDSLRFGFSFGLPNTYSEFFEFWENVTTCSGTPTQTLVLLEGTYSAGATRYNSQSAVYERPFDFFPQQNSEGFQPCFNLLRVSGSQLFLGIASGAAFGDEGDEPGSCGSAATRPFTVSTAFPFVKGSLPDDTDTANPTPNNPPVSNAGPDQTVSGGASVTLNGSASTDRLGGTNLTYAWSGGSGQVVLQNANTAIASFTAPSSSSGQTLAFTLTVTDAATGLTDTDQVNVTVSAASQQPPVVNAGADQSTTSSRTVTLRGTVTPSDNVSLQWVQLSGPPVTLTGGDTLTPSFMAPDVPSGAQPQTLVFRLAASRGGSATVADEVSVLVSSVALNNGNLRFTLTWSPSGSDQDLYVMEPSGDLIFFASNFRCQTAGSGGQPATNCVNSRNGGALDVDDTSGPGPENIFYGGTVVNGTYCYGVRYFSSSGQPTTNTITVNLNGNTVQTSTAAFSAPSSQGTRQTAFFVMMLNGSSATFRPAAAADFSNQVCPTL